LDAFIDLLFIYLRIYLFIYGACNDITDYVRLHTIARYGD